MIANTLYVPSASASRSGAEIYDLIIIDMIRYFFVVVFCHKLGKTNGMLVFIENAFIFPLPWLLKKASQGRCGFDAIYLIW
jgi:hypothetical protein